MTFRRAFSTVRHVNRVPEIGRCFLLSKNPASQTLAYLGIKPIKYPCQAQLRTGHVIDLCEWDDLATLWTIYYHREYRLQGDEQTIVDIGGNIGAFALWAAIAAPNARICSIEAVPSTFERLVKTISSNGLGLRIIPVLSAVGRKDGEIEMDVSPGGNKPSTAFCSFGKPS